MARVEKAYAANFDPVLVKCWANVFHTGPALYQHRLNVSYVFAVIWQCLCCDMAMTVKKQKSLSQHWFNVGYHLRRKLASIKTDCADEETQGAKN